MVTEQEKQRAVQSFSQNPYWREYYETAPSTVCKEWIALTFCYSDGVKKDEVVKEHAALEPRLSKADWAHLYKYEGNNPFKAKCKRNMK